MAGIIVYNITQEDHSRDANNYPIYRPSILSNPFIHTNDKKVSSVYKSKDVEEAVKRYSNYFDTMYSGNLQFKNVIDEIYDKYRNGETIYLESYYSEEPNHGTVIKNKLQQRLIKEKIKELKK